MYVITSKADQGQDCGKVVYYALDGPSGGYPYWTQFLGNAKFFDTVQEAVDRMRKELLHAKPETMTSGKIYPATLVHSALGLSNIVKKGTSTVCVVKIELVTVSENYISGEIK